MVYWTQEECNAWGIKSTWQKKKSTPPSYKKKKSTWQKSNMENCGITPFIRSQSGVDGYLQLSTWQMEVLKDTKQDKWHMVMPKLVESIIMKRLHQ